MAASRLLIFAFLHFFFFSFCTAQHKDAVLNDMHRANDWFMQKHPDPGQPTFVKKERPSNLWTRGVYYEGLMALIRIDSRIGDVDYLRRWGMAHNWTPRNGVTTRDADDYCCSQAYLEYAQWEANAGLRKTIDKEKTEPTIRCMTNLLNNPSSIHDWTWIDAIQMGLPVLTRLASMDTDHSEAWDEQGWRMYTWTRDTLAGGLFNRKEGLWWRDKDFVPPYREPNGRNCYWSRGNGWVYAALVRAMDCGTNHYEDYKADFLSMTEALVKCQRHDRFWNVSLHDAGNYGGRELTGTALFTYGMAWGVNNGVLDARTYRPIVLKTWRAMVRHCLRHDGFLHYVQGTGKEPKDSQPVGKNLEPDFDDFGLGCFLLAGSEVYKLLGRM